MIWTAVLVAFGFRIFAFFDAALIDLGFDTGQFLSGTLSSLPGQITIEVVGVYMTLVSMRLIGLYYLHFKHRFAFALE